MRRMMILVTLALVGLFLLNGQSSGLEADGQARAVAELNHVVDDQLQTRVEMLALGAELSAAWTER